MKKTVDALFIHHRITASPSTPVQAECYLAGGGCCLESRTWRSRGSGRSSCSESEPASRRKNKVRSSQASRHKVKSQCYDWGPLRNRGCSFTLYHTGKIRGMELKTKSKDLFVPQCGELLQSMRKNRRGGSIWAKKTELWVDLRNLWKVQHNSGRGSLVGKGITVERETRMCTCVTLAGDQKEENHREIRMRGADRVDH